MATKKVTMKVFGMTCDDCVRTVSKGLTDAGGSEIWVSLEGGMASAVIDDNKILPEDLAKIPVFGERSHYKAQVRKVE